jgi:general secretion pathway protein L
MPDRLLLRLAPDGSLAWLAQDASGRALSGANAGAPPRETLARARQVAVLVPAETVLLTETPAVSRQRAQLAKAIPFALEERLASPVEDLHFALPTEIGADALPVAIVARDTLRGWIAQLAEQGIQPDALVPETLALPLASDATTVVIDGDRALIRNGATQASACATAHLDVWLAALGPQPVVLEIHDFRNAAPLSPNSRVARYHERQRDVLAFLAAHLPAQPTLNLLQGEFAPAHRQVPAQKLWRLAAMLAAAAVASGLLYSFADWFKLNAESARLDASMRDVLHASFPKFDNVAGDPNQLMQSEIARLKGTSEASGALRVLGQIAPVLGSNTRVVLRGLEYHNATLELVMRAPDVQTLDLVREQLASLGGLKAEVTSANPSDGLVEGRVRITAGKS